MEAPIPDAVLALLRDRLTSLDELEILLQLRADGVGGATETELVERTTPAREVEAETLEHLRDVGLVASESVGESMRWRYAPQTPELAADVDVLAELYERRRIEIVRLLSAQAVDRIRSSAATAFGIGKKRD